MYVCQTRVSDYQQPLPKPAKPSEPPWGHYQRTGDSKTRVLTLSPCPENLKLLRPTPDTRKQTREAYTQADISPRKALFLPGARPDELQAVKTGLHAEELAAAGRGDEEVPSLTRKWTEQWSAVEQQRAAARAEPMALPMLQRSWAKIKQAIDSRAPKRLQVIQELLVRGLDLDFTSLGRDQPSVLWLAAANNDLEVLQMCLACGADPHRDSSGVLPTEVAASTGALQALALLLRIGAVPGRFPGSVHFAAATSQIGALRVLINTRAELRTRVHGLSALAIAVARDHDEAMKLLLAQTWGQEPPLGQAACEALGLEEGSNILHLAALGGLDRACDLLLQRGVRPQPAGLPRAAGTQFAQEQVRAVLEPQRWMLLRRLWPEGAAKSLPVHEAFKQVLDECGSDPKVVAVCAGVGALRPTSLAALMDDAEAIKLLAATDISEDPLPGASPSALMWAQWSSSQQAARVMLDAGVTLSNADLEGLRRLGRARRQSQDSKTGSDAPSAAARLLDPSDWSLLPQAVQHFASATPLSRLQDLREKMLFGISEVRPADAPAIGGLLPVPMQPPALTRVTSISAEQEEAAAKEEVAASALLDLLGPAKASIIRFLVQREIAQGEGRSGLSAIHLLALHAAATFVDVHAQCQLYMPLLKSALGALPSARGPCYRAVMRGSSKEAPSLRQFSLGSVVQWPAATAGTLDFGAAMAALSLGAEASSMGIMFKVRRLLSAKEVSEKQVLFIGGSMRVVGLFALSGPLLAAERELAAQGRSLDMARRPEVAQPAELEQQPLVMVLLDEETLLPSQGLFHRALSLDPAMSFMLGLLKLCLLAALCLGVGSETLSARVWQPSRPDFQLPESFEGSLNPGWNLESKLNFGIALAGGGMRGGALGHGVLRTLREAKLLEKARYLSVTSGSVWLGLPLYYQALDTVEEYLGQTLRPEDMTPEALIQKTGSGLRRLRHFRNYPKGHKGPPPEQLLQRELLEENETSLESMFGCPADEGWCACMVERFQPGSFHGLYSVLTAYAFLHPFELAGWGSTHCHESQLERVRAKFGSGKTIYTSKDVSRKLPFLLSQSAILEPYTGLTKEDPLVFFPLEQTPLYAGTIPGYNATDVHRSIGDVLVEPFAWGSRARSPWTNFSNGGELRMDVSRSFLNVGDLATWAGTATSYIADFQIRTWADKIPKCLVAEGEKLLPHANFWSPLALDSAKVPLAHEEAVGDAGVYDDIGHIPLLRRKVKKIAIFTSGAIHDDLCEMTYVLAAFGQPGCLQPPNPPGASNPKMKAGGFHAQPS
ncbi:unnamed protein product [Symbiodinium microadriaticum]|nr:unnamed protein product [Symbiodinium microadriaticum]